MAEGKGRSRRIDQALVERGLAESRSQAQRLIMAGQVRVEGQVVLKASQGVGETESIAIDPGPRFVSRGGEKLQAALNGFSVDPGGWVCADVGASTGGFTDCLLQHGARRVYAIDVGRGILHWTIRNDPRVTNMEGTNVRHVERLPEAVRLVTVDAAFISLRLILPRVAAWLEKDGQIIALVKPQFEAGKGVVPRNGVVRDPETQRAVLRAVVEAAGQAGLAPKGLLRSPLKGPKGNIEFLLLAGNQGLPGDPEAMIDGVVPP
jgi:23S rRNA (cytidine1920-2'-O)/16S rRNA (cytidine1409-2'-O)-methyltransferase